VAAGESFDFAWPIRSSVMASAARRFSRQAAVRSVEVAGSFEDEVGLLDQVAEGVERIPVNWHASIVRWIGPEGNLSDLSINAHSTQYPKIVVPPRSIPTDMLRP
jgi:hypothetical protein